MTDGTKQTAITDVVEQDETPRGEEPELYAEGIQSVVQKDGETVGHVLLVDWDDWTPNDRVREYAEDLAGVTFITESSPGSFHLWNLTVRELDETALELLKLKSDPQRTMLGYRWRPPRWVTRISAKRRRADDSVYKDPPELVSMSINPTTRRQSKAHWLMARNYIKGFPPETPDTVNWRQCGTVVDKYKAYSDEQKARWDGGQDG